MQSSSDDELISSIAPEVMKCLGRCKFFERLDDLLSPEGALTPAPSCVGTFQLSESILNEAGFDRGELDEILAVLQSKGGFCDCEILYNVAETSRLKANYWRSQAAGQAARTLPGPARR
jgi:Protein of unknown function (DUF2695)